MYYVHVRGAGRSERRGLWVTASVTAALTEPTDTTAAAAAAANETSMPSKKAANVHD